MVAVWRLARCWPEGGAGARVPTSTWSSPSMACGVAWSIHYYCVFLAVPLALTALDATRTGTVAGDGEGHGAVLPDGRWACSSCSRRFCWRNRPRPGATSSRTARSSWTVRPITGCLPICRRYITLLVDGLDAAGRGAWRHRRRAARWRPTAAGRSCCFRSRCRFCCSSATPFRRAAISIPSRPSSCSWRRWRSAISQRAGLRARRVLVLALTLLRRLALWSTASTPCILRRRRHAHAGAASHRRPAPDGATVLVQPYSVQLAQSRDSLEESLAARLGVAERAPHEPGCAWPSRRGRSRPTAALARRRRARRGQIYLGLRRSWPRSAGGPAGASAWSTWS